MAYSKRIGGAWRAAAKRWVYLGTVWRPVRRGWIYASGAWRLYFIGADPMSVSIGPTDFTSFQNSTVSGTLSSLVTGGLAPFTYVWSVVSFTAGSPPSFGSPTSASTSVSQTGVMPSGIEFAQIMVTVTDSAGQNASASKSASFTNIDFS